MADVKSAAITDEELRILRSRVARRKDASLLLGYRGTDLAAEDAAVLIAEVDRLRAELSDRVKTAAKHLIDGLPDEAWNLLRDVFNAGYEVGYHNGGVDEKHSFDKHWEPEGFDLARDEDGIDWANRLHEIVSASRDGLTVRSAGVVSSGEALDDVLTVARRMASRIQQSTRRGVWADPAKRGRSFYYRDPYWVISQSADGPRFEGSSDMKEKADDLAQSLKLEAPTRRVMVVVRPELQMAED